jgi:hypothetical protein
MKDVQVVSFAVRDKDYRRNAATQIQERVYLYGSVALAVLGPREQRKAQVDHRGIERVCSPLQFDTEAVANIKLACGNNQRLGEVGVDAPVANLIRIRQSIARNAAADAHVVKLRARRTQTCFYIAKTFPIRQLCECHAQKLIPAGKALEFVVAVVTIDAPPELRRRKKIHQLREDRLARIHVPPPVAKLRQDAVAPRMNSNRFSSFDG